MRSRVYDAIELVASLIAEWSHLKEHIVHKIQNDEDATDEIFIYNMIIERRRCLMHKIETELGIDATWHCLLKHAIAAYWYAVELEDADPAFDQDSVWATDLLNAILSKATGKQIEFCSRCLGDLLTKKEE